MIEIRTATTADEREAIYRSRYDIYVEEMGRYRAVADHEGRRLADPEDEHSWLFYATDGTDVIGSFRTTWGGDGFSERQIRQYDLEPFLAEIPAERMAVGERTMIPPSWRGMDVFPILAEGSSELMERQGVQVVFGACEPHLLSFYCRFQRPYAPRNINSPEAGYLIPLVSYPQGPEVFDGLGPDGAGLPRCVAETLAGTGAVRTPVLEDPATYVSEVTDRLGALDASVFDGLTPEELATCVARSVVVGCAEGDRLIKDGGSAHNVFVVLAGALEVTADGHAVGVALPGEVVGEMAFLLERARSFDVEVLRDDTLVLGLSDTTLRSLREHAPVAAAKLYANLSKLLCKRLVSHR